MNSEPLVSIITSCYNHERYLDEYMAGLLAQTYRNIEVILFDDGSTDGSWAKILSYIPALKKRFGRVVCKQHEHAGLLLELDAAVKVAGGEYFCFIASDDCYLPDMVETSVNFLNQNPEYGVVHGDADYCFTDRVVRSYRKTFGLPVLRGDVYEQALKNHSFFVCSACFRSLLVRKHVNFGRYAELNYYAEDYPMCLDIFRVTKVGYIDRPLARYRARGEFSTFPQKLNKIPGWFIGNYKIRFDHINKYGLTEDLRLEVLKNYYATLYVLSYRYCLTKEFLRAYRWLGKNDGHKYSKLQHFTRLLIIHNHFLRVIAGYFIKYRAVRRLRTIQRDKILLEITPRF